MAAGLQPTLAGVNNQAANLVMGLRNTLISINEFYVWLEGFGAAGLEGLGMDDADAAVMVSALADLNDLYSIYYDKASIRLTGTYNYQTFAGQLTAYS